MAEINLKLMLGMLDELTENQKRLSGELLKNDRTINELRDMIVKQLREDHPLRGKEEKALHPVFLEETYLNLSIQDACDVVIDYLINETEFVADIKQLSPDRLTLFRRPIGMLWAARIRLFRHNAKIPAEHLNEWEFLRSNKSGHISYDDISKRSWSIDYRLLDITREEPFRFYFGDGTEANEHEVSRLRARFILLVELIRWSATAPFENGSRAIISNSRDQKSYASFITPNGLLRHMRFSKKEPEKSVKVETFRSYLFTRLKSAPAQRAAPTAQTAPAAPAIAGSVYTLNLTPQTPRHPDNRPFVGHSIKSQVSKTPTNLQIPYSGYYVVKFRVRREEKVATAYRVFNASATNLQATLGILNVYQIVNDLYDETPYLEEFSYEDWQSMGPKEMDGSFIRLLDRYEGSLPKLLKDKTAIKEWYEGK